MTNTKVTIVLVLGALFCSSIPNAQAGTEWVDISDSTALRKIVGGKVLDGRYWLHYYRADGNMAYYYPEADTMAIRKWKIEEGGKLCTAPFLKPELSLGCFTLQQASNGSPKYRMIWRSGINAFEFLDEPPENLSKALNDTAGSVQ